MRRFSVLALAVVACTSSTETAVILEPDVPPVAPRPGTLERTTPASLTAVVGTLIGPATVLVRDQNGHPLAGVAVVVTADSNSGYLLDNSLRTGADGTATAEWMAGPVAGNQSITARSEGLVAVSFTAAVRPGPVASITRLLGNNQHGLERTGLPNPLSVKVTDSFYNAIAGVQVIFTVIVGDGSIAGDTATTNSVGIADSGEWILGGNGSQQVRAQSGSAQITFDAMACSSVAWGCAEFDGAATTLVFVRGRQLYRTSFDGTQVVRITNDEVGYNFHPAWSPDRSRIAFVRFTESVPGIYILKAGGEVTRLTNSGEYYAPKWSPDGRQLAFAGFGPAGTGIYLMNPDLGGALPVRLIQGWSPTWSPDGARIAFLNGGGIHVINADGTGLSLLAPSDRWLDHPNWSPDGRSIAVTTYSNCDWEDDCDSSIEVLDVGRSQFRVLVPGTRGRNYASGPAWSPDGSTIAFSLWACTTSGCAASVSAINADGTRERIIVADGGGPSWRR